MDFDDILEEIGGFGKYQLTNYLLICLPVFFSAANSLSYIFTAGVPSYRCFVPGCDDLDNPVFDSHWVQNAVPGKIDNQGNFNPEQCLLFESDFQPHYNGTCSELIFQSESVSCNRWVYDKHERTIVQEWGLTCPSNQWKLSLVGTLHFAGILVGSGFFGLIADKYGRKNVLTVSILMMSITGIAQAFSTSYGLFLCWNFLNAVGTSGVYPMAFILGVELVGKNKREMSGNVLNFFYALGEAVVGLFAWLYGDWVIVQLLVSAPPIGFVIYHWLVPESVRWLLIKDKNEKAHKIIRKAAKVNGVELSERLLANFEKVPVGEMNEGNLEKHSEKGKLVQTIKLALKSKVLVLRYILTVYSWIANAFVYYGLSLNSVTLSGNKYLNYMLVCLIEIPGYSISWFVMKKCGRRWALGCALLVCALTCALGGIVSQDALLLILFLIGKLSVTISFAVLYTYTTEMLPTSIRSCGVGAASLCARFGALLAPFVPILGAYMEALPLLLFSLLSLIGGVTAFFLPETLMKKLPDTVEEAEALSMKPRQNS